MRTDRVLAAEEGERPPRDGVVGEEVGGHVHALARVAAPHPAVALDAVEVELPRRQVQRIRRDIPDAVDFLVVAPKRPTVFKRKILAFHREGRDADVARKRRDADVAEGARDRQSVRRALRRIERDVLPHVHIQPGIRLLSRFAVDDSHRPLALDALQNHEAECLAPEVGEHAVPVPRLADGILRRKGHAEDGRLLLGLHAVVRRRHADRLVLAPPHRPPLPGLHRRALEANRRRMRRVVDTRLQGVVARLEGDVAVLHGKFLPVERGGEIGVALHVNAYPFLLLQ